MTTAPLSIESILREAGVEPRDIPDLHAASAVMPPSEADSIAAMCQQAVDEAHQLAAGSLSEAEINARIEALDSGNAAEERMIDRMNAFNDSERSFQDAMQVQQDLMDRDMAHHYRMMEIDANSDADHHADMADRGAAGGHDVSDDLTQAASDSADAHHYHEMADLYDPDTPHDF